MCGIAGIVDQDPARRGRIEPMLATLVHRGPDDQGIEQDAFAVLGQRRLSIIDLAGGHQPIPNADGSAWIVCNGEVYNYRELRAELEAGGARFRCQSDTEVILQLYERDGIGCLQKLRGMFAFAIWDSRNQTLFCARDRLGQKPFFYAQSGAGFAFASEIKALLAFDPALRTLNKAALDQYLNLRIIASPDSMFEGVRKLPPAHYLTFKPGAGVTVAPYWNLRYEPKWTGPDDDLIDELEALLVDTLRVHMVSDVAVGAFMSGGLDSTLIVAMLMRHVCREPLQTFTMGLPYEQFDEAPAARLVAEKYGTLHREETTLPSLLADLPQLVWHLDEPSDPLSICTYLLARFAARHVKVVLGGDGGDELFGGYDRYYGNVYAGAYARIPAFLRRGVIGPLLSLMPDGRWYKSRAHQFKWLHDLSFREGGERYARSLSYFYFGSEWRDRLYGEAMRRGSTAFDPSRAIREMYEAVEDREPVDRMLHADSFIRLPDHPVMITDRMTMAHSLEARAPFMDHELVEFTARLPVQMKVRGRTLRYVQRRLAERYLPAELLTRPKQGFASALPYLLRKEYEILFDCLLRSSQLAADGYLRQAGIDAVLAEHRSGRHDHGNRLWLLVNSEAWYRAHFQRGGIDGLRSLLQEANGKA